MYLIPYMIWSVIIRHGYILIGRNYIIFALHMAFEWVLGLWVWIYLFTGILRGVSWSVMRSQYQWEMGVEIKHVLALSCVQGAVHPGTSKNGWSLSLVANTCKMWQKCYYQPYLDNRFKTMSIFSVGLHVGWKLRWPFRHSGHQGSWQKSDWDKSEVEASNKELGDKGNAGRLNEKKDESHAHACKLALFLIYTYIILRNRI